MVKIAVFAALLMTAVAACGKQAPAAKSADQRAAEQAADQKTIRSNPVYGDQVKALDAAKETQKALDEAAAANTKKIDEMLK
jgi:hypothetical protein